MKQFLSETENDHDKSLIANTKLLKHTGIPQILCNQIMSAKYRYFTNIDICASKSRQLSICQTKCNCITALLLLRRLII